MRVYDYRCWVRSLGVGLVGEICILLPMFFRQNVLGNNTRSTPTYQQ